MSKKEWLRDEVTKIPLGRFQGRDEKYPGADDRYQNEKGMFDLNRYPDVTSANICAGMENIAKAARYSRYYFQRYVLPYPGSFFHIHKVLDCNSRTIGWITTIESAQAGGENYRQTIVYKTWEKNLNRGRYTDVSSDTNF